MALQGTLKDFSLADIFQLIGIQRKTGVLTLKSGQETATVAFVEGQVVGADSTGRRLEDRLGSVLVKTGRITEAQLQEALRVQHSTLNRLGTILVESKFIDAAGLSEALQVQISQMVYRLFRWTAGEYHFSQEARVDYDREHVAPMSAESILMEGARILDEWPMIEKAIRSFRTVFRHANVVIAGEKRAGRKGSDQEAAGDVTLSDSERLVYALVDGKRPVQDIVERSSLSEFDTCRNLYELINRHLLEEVRESAARPGAPPAAPAARARASSPILAGLGAMLLVLVAGGALLARGVMWVTDIQAGNSFVLALRPVLSPATRERVSAAVARGRVQRIDSALHVYYLLNRGYPADLHYLVTDGLLRADTLFDPSGTPIKYVATPDGYDLSQ